MFFLKNNIFFSIRILFMFLIKKIYILYLQEKNEGIFDEGLDLSFN